MPRAMNRPEAWARPEPIQVDFDCVVVGHARIEGLDVAYLEVPVGDDSWRHWYIAAGDDGVRFASPISRGRLACRGMTDRREIEAEIVGYLGEVFRESDPDSDARVVQAFTQGISRHGMPEPLMPTLGDHGIAVTTWRPDEARRAIEAALAPVRLRLGERVRLFHDYDAHRAWPAIRHARRALDEDAAKARILKLAGPEVAGVASLGSYHALLREIVRMPRTRLAGPASDILASLMEELDVTKAAARRKRAGPYLNRHDVMALRAMPVDWLPSPDDREAWQALGTLAAMLDAVGIGEEDWRRLAGSSKGRWEEFLDRCLLAAFGKQIPPPEMGCLQGAIRSSIDVTGAFNAWLTTAFQGDPEAWRYAYRTAKAAVEGDRCLPAILENSRLWHARFKAPAPSGLRWEAILPSWTDPRTGIEIAPLTGSDDLVAEGEAMGHCVGGEAFSLDCMRDEIRVLSLRSGGDRIATAEIALGPAHKVVQHFGPRNSEPSEDAVRALRDYRYRPEYRRAVRSVARRKAHLPRRARADMEALLDRWRPYLTGRWKRSTIEDFRRALMVESHGIAHDAGATPEIRSRPEGPTP